MKKEVMFLFLILVFSNLVLAECLSSDQLIMRLQNPQDSIVSLWDAYTPSGGTQDCPSGMISYWTFDGNSLNDFEGTNHLSVIPTGNSAQFSDGNINNAIGIKNKEYYLEVADNPTLDITGSLTMEAWVYMQTWDGSGKKYIISKDSTDSDEDYAIFFNGGYLKCKIDKLNGGAKVVQKTVSSLDVFRTSGWHHIACTYDKQAGSLILYFDGVVKDTAPPFTGFELQTNDLSLKIGKDCEDEDSAMKLDEVALYNVALSSSQISEHYNNIKNYCPSTESQNIYFSNEICYNEIWGEDFISVDPHFESTPCDSSNAILWLQNSQGSEITLTPSSTFSIPICYGNLVCNARTAGTCYPNLEKPILKLNSKTSSTTASISTGNGAYDLCCSSGPGFTGAYWGDLLQGAQIGNADLNDTVKLNVIGKEFLGKTLRYEIYKNNFWWKDKLIVSETSENNFIIWKMNESGTFYFNATIVGESNNKTVYSQSFLTVSNTVDNSLPYIELQKPVDKQIYPLNSQINFSIIVKDIDSILDYSWDFGDGNTKIGTSLEAKNFAIDNFHTYTTAGQKNIILKITEDNKLISQKRISISIPDLTATNSKNILAYIDFPNFKPDASSEIFQTNLAGFNAESSFAYTATLSSGITQISCVMGACPAKTDGCFTCTGTPSAGCQTGCKIDITSTYLPYNTANFSWTFYKLETSPVFDFITSNLGLYNLSRRFSYGLHSAILNILIGTFSSQNNITFQTGGCSPVDKKTFTDGEGTIFNTRDSGICGNYDPACCEDGYTCRSESEGSETKTCLPIIVDANIEYCADYNAQDKCNEDANGIGDEDNLEWIDFGHCGGIVNDYRQICKNCTWDNDECVFYIEQEYVDPTEEEIPDYFCSISSTSDGNCEIDDFISYLSSATLRDETGKEITDELIREETGCVNKTESEIPCPTQTELGFFGFTQFVICILGIFLVYFLFRRK